MGFQQKMDWVKYIRDVYARGRKSGIIKTTPIFSPAASPELIRECESKLGVAFPDSLKQLMNQTNGVKESISTSKGEIESGYFLLSIERILETNSSLRAYGADVYMPLDCLLFFAEDGVGDYFGFSVIKGKVFNSQIFIWKHEDDSRICIAPSLEYLIENWLLGKLRV